MCPKCKKGCCEPCIKNKKKKNKFCSFCNYYLNDIPKYIEAKNINYNTNKTNFQRYQKNFKNKNIKDINDKSLNKSAEQDNIYDKRNLHSHEIENTPSFNQKKPDKRNKKYKNVIRNSDGAKNNNLKKDENDEDNRNIKKAYDNKKPDNKKTKKIYEIYNEPNSNKYIKKKIKQKESFNAEDLDDYNNKDTQDKDKVDENKIIIKRKMQNHKQYINNKDNKENKDSKNSDNEKDDNNYSKDNNLNNEEKNENENENDKDNDKDSKNLEEEKTNNNDNCLEHKSNQLKFYCFHCDKEYCEECLKNHSDDLNLINYSNIDKFKELLTQKKEVVNRNITIQKYLNDFEQKAKSYKLEKDLFISEINKIANDYIANIDSQINEINIIIEKLKKEQNIINETNNLINEKFNLFHKLYTENNNNYEDINTNFINENLPNENIEYGQDIQKWNKNINFFKFNYFTSQFIHNVQIDDVNSDTIIFSKLFFNKDNLNSFINDLKINNDNIVDKNDDNNDENELNNVLFKDDKNINNDSFSIKNWDKKALIQVNIDLKKDKKNNIDSFTYNNVSCYLLIGCNELNNYCKLGKKMMNKGNLCMYEVIPWEQFNIFNYNNLNFKVLLFNHN